MPIKSNIPELLKQHEKNASDLMRATGSAYSTANYLAKGRLGDSISLSLLEKICAFFNVGVGDVLYVSDEETPDEQ